MAIDATDSPAFFAPDDTAQQPPFQSAIDTTVRSTSCLAHDATFFAAQHSAVRGTIDTTIWPANIEADDSTYQSSLLAAVEQAHQGTHRTTQLTTIIASQ